MNNILIKFSNYLESYKNEVSKQLAENFYSLPTSDCTDNLMKLDKELIIINNFLDILDGNNTNQFFFDYDILSRFLENFNFNSKECSYIIFNFIKRNLSCKNFNLDAYIVDDEKIDKHRFKNLTNEEAKEMICNIVSDDFDDVLLDSDKDKIEELIEFAKKNSRDCNYFINNHKSIEEYYFKKNDSYDEEDIKAILVALKNLKVSDSMLKMVLVYLKKGYKKRSNLKESIAFNWDTKNTSKDYTLSNKEYKSIRKELSLVYDIYNNELLKPITSKEMIYYLSLMMKLDFDEDTINNFILRVYTSLPKITNPYQEFISIYDKILYYQDNYQVKKLLEDILVYMNSDIFIPEKLEDYDEAKSDVSRCLTELKYHIPNKYKYEKECARRLIREFKD